MSAIYWNIIAQEVTRYEDDWLKVGMVAARTPFNEYVRDRIERMAFSKMPRARYLDVLDVGCGIGQWTLLLASRLDASVTGIDLSPSMIEVARNRAEMLRAKNVEFRVMDATKITFQNNRFDLVFCITVLQHVMEEQEWKEAIRGMVRVAKPSSYIMIVEAAPLKYDGPRRSQESYVHLRNEYVHEFKMNGGILLGEYPIDPSRPLLRIGSRIMTIEAERDLGKKINFYSAQLSKRRQKRFSLLIYKVIISMAKLIDQYAIELLPCFANLAPGRLLIFKKHYDATNP